MPELRGLVEKTKLELAPELEAEALDELRACPPA